MENNPSKIVLFEACNYLDFPIGGQLSFMKSIIASGIDNLILIGITTSNIRIGKWTKISIHNREYDYFPYMKIKTSSKRPLIPRRLTSYFAIKRYKKQINLKITDNVITQAPEIVLAISNWNISNLCYYFAGTENPITFSRYKFATHLGSLFDRIFLPQLIKCKLILAAADTNAINELVIRSKGTLIRSRIYQFPTRVDTQIFKYRSKTYAREILQIPSEELMIITTGRLSWIKGWKFMIDSFKLFTLTHPGAKLYFIGNGEDFEKIISYISEIKMEKFILLVGSKTSDLVANYLSASDLFIMGSYKEGWSTSLIEAISCGIPACVTNFSSAKDIIHEGINGYIEMNHNELHFSELMNRSLLIDRTYLPRKIDVDKYSVNTLNKDLLNIWPLV
jgi:glycosyltransferase involved in cell wall biosynthesis